MQIQNIRDFVRRMPDILGRHEQIQPYGNCNRAAAQALIVTKAGHRYNMQVVAAYASQEPNGLGQILLRGPGDYRVVSKFDSNGQMGPILEGSGGDAIRGPLKDETWATIVQYIREHESGVPHLPPPPDPSMPQPVPGDDPALKPSDDREPRLGEVVLFLARPGEGARECVSLVTRVHSPVLVDLLVMPPGHQPVVQVGISRRTPRNDRHVWEFAGHSVSVEDAISSYDRAFDRLKDEFAGKGQMTVEIARAHADIAELRKRLDDITAAKSAEDPERDRLRTEAESLGIVVDRRWGAERLRKEIEEFRKPVETRAEGLV